MIYQFDPSTRRFLLLSPSVTGIKERKRRDLPSVFAAIVGYLGHEPEIIGLYASRDEAKAAIQRELAAHAAAPDHYHQGMKAPAEPHD
jgi:hypothetical protein